MEDQVNAAKSVDLLHTQLRFTLWFIGVLMGIVAFFIVRAFNKQDKKDEKQDHQIEKMGEMFGAITDAVKGIEKSIALSTQTLQQHEKHIEKHDRILENWMKGTKR